MQGKQESQEMYDDCLGNGKYEYMATGSMKPVPGRLVVEWIIKSREEISNETVINSMKSCALALAVDGTEDGLISCFKEGKNVKQEERYWKCDISNTRVISLIYIYIYIN